MLYCIFYIYSRFAISIFFQFHHSNRIWNYNKFLFLCNICILPDLLSMP